MNISVRNVTRKGRFFLWIKKTHSKIRWQWYEQDKYNALGDCTTKNGSTMRDSTLHSVQNGPKPS